MERCDHCALIPEVRAPASLEGALRMARYLNGQIDEHQLVAAAVRAAHARNPNADELNRAGHPENQPDETVCGWNVAPVERRP